MDVVLLMARIVMAAVFLVAGVGKLADLAGSRAAVAGFGVPEVLARPFGLLLPIVELIVAALLLPVATAWVASLAALALLAAFVAGIAVNMARGRAPDCHCFGQLHSEPVGWATLGRNGVLALVAGVIAVAGKAGPGPSLIGWLGPLSAAQRVGIAAGVVVALLVAVEGWLLLHLLQQNGRLLLRLEALEALPAGSAAVPTPAAPSPPPPGLPLGTPAPGFALTGLYGETLTLDALRAAGRPLVLVFSDPGCGPCNALMPEIGAWQRRGDTPTVVLVSRGDVEANRDKAAEHRLTHVLLQQDREVAAAYQANATPSAVLVRPDGTVGSTLAQGADAIRALVLPATAPTAPAPAAAPAAVPAASGGNGTLPGAGGRIGQPAPEVALPDLDGRTVRLSELSGRDTLVLFWNPQCGFCQRMLEDLKAWERQAPADAPRLLVISTGEVTANRAQGLRAPVLLDQGFSAGQAFGATGTPSAVRVDAAGRIASEVRVGAEAVLALAGGQPAAANGNGNGNGGGVPPPSVPRLGQLAPPLKLPDVNGKTVRLSDFRGSRLVLLFWNPGCGFCQRMIEDLKAWEERRPKDAPKLLLVTRGTAEENRALGLRSTMVLDQEFRMGRAFGANGTPMGVLIDAQGRMASEVVAGAEAVLALALARGDAVGING